MLVALKAVQEGTMSINCGATEYGVHKTTLQDQVARRVMHGSNPGPKPYLSAEEEQDLAECLITSARIG